MASYQIVTSCHVVTSCQVVTTCAANLPSDDMAQSNREGLWGFYPHSRLRLSPDLQLDDFAQSGGKGGWRVFPHSRLRLSPDLPRYVADKRPEGALSASFHKKENNFSDFQFQDFEFPGNHQVHHNKNPETFILVLHYRPNVEIARL